MTPRARLQPRTRIGPTESRTGPTARGLVPPRGAPTRLALVLTLVALTVGSGFGGALVAASPTDHGAPRPLLAPPALSAAAAPAPSNASAPTPAEEAALVKVGSTLDLINDTVQGGNYEPANLAFAGPLVGLPSSSLVIGVTASPFTGGGVAYEFDTATQQVTAWAPLGPVEPEAVALASNTGTVFVADCATSNLSLYHTAPFGFDEDLPTAGCPDALAFDGALGTMLVTSASDNLLLSINTSTYASHAYGVGVEPVAVAYDAADAIVVVANYETTNLTFLNASTFKLLGNLALPDYPTALTVAPNGTVYVALATSHVVTAVDATSETAGRSFDVGSDPTALYLDPASSILFVAGDAAPANLSEVNVSSGVAAGSVPLPGGPHALGVDGQGDTLVVTASQSYNLTLVSTASLDRTASIVVGASPSLVTVDPDTENLFTVDDISGGLTEANVTLALPHPAGVLPSGGEFDTAAADAPNGTLWFVSEGSDVISEVNGSTGRVYRTYDHNATGGSLAFDAYDNRLFLGNLSSDTVIPFSAKNGYPDPGVKAVPAPTASYFDRLTGRLYVGSGETGPAFEDLAVLNGTRETVVHDLDGYGGITSIVKDPLNGMIFATSLGCGCVYVVNSSTEGLVTAIALPGGEDALASVFDPVSDLLYVAEALSDNVTLIDPIHDKVVGGVTVGFTPVSLAYDYDGGYVAAANLVGGTVSILPDPGRFAVIFHERGLRPADVAWGVAGQGTLRWSNSSTLDYYVLNGSFAWQLDVPIHFNTSGGPVSGSVVVNGSDVDVYIHFTVNGTRFPVVFYERGLPYDTNWTVVLNGTRLSGTGQTLVTTLQNFTYPYYVPALPGYLPSPASSELVMNGSLVNTTITWNATLYPVTFVASGLASGVLWTASVGNYVNHSTGADLVLEVPNGSYSFTVSVSGYTASPSTGHLNVSGGPVSESISFRLIPAATQTGAPPPPLDSGAIALGIIALAVVAAALAVFAEWRERRALARPPAPPAPPPLPEPAMPAGGEATEGPGGASPPGPT